MPFVAQIDGFKKLGHVHRNQFMELYVYAKCMSPTATNTLGTVGKSLDHLQKYCWGWEGLNDERMRQYGERVNIAVVKKKVLVGCSLSFHSFIFVFLLSQWSWHNATAYFGVNGFIKTAARTKAAEGIDETSEANIQKGLTDSGGNANSLNPAMFNKIMCHYQGHKKWLEENKFAARHPDTLREGHCGLTIAKTQNSKYTKVSKP